MGQILISKNIYEYKCFCSMKNKNICDTCIFLGSFNCGSQIPFLNKVNVHKKPKGKIYISAVRINIFD